MVQLLTDASAETLAACSADERSWPERSSKHVLRLPRTAEENCTCSGEGIHVMHSTLLSGIARLASRKAAPHHVARMTVST